MQQDRQGSQMWRELLKNLNTDEKRRIVSALGIQEKTLERWIRGQTEFPRPGRIRQIMNALPIQTRVRFIELIQEDPHFSRYASEISLPKVITSIPSTFYSRIIEANVVAPQELRFMTICHLILLQAVGQLGSDQQGLYMMILKCTPPAPGEKVRSLSQQFSLGTFPWSTIIEQKSFFMGVESMAGQAIKDRSSCIIQDIRNNGGSNLISVHQDRHLVSAAALLIQKGGRIAGSLLVYSTQPGFFTSDRLKLIQRYCQLMVIAIGDDEFYEQQQIELRLMPAFTIQQKYLTQFHQRVLIVARQAHLDGHPRNWLEAEREARQHIESELLEVGNRDQAKEGSIETE